MPELSVVVIIYKVEKYLCQCVDSILAQTYRDFELILVDDGSPDGCPYICDEYARKDNRVKVIHQKNQGSVAARYNGLLAATGEYVSLIDGDDWLDCDMYEKMMWLVKKNNADMAVVGYKEGTENNYIEKQNMIESGFYDADRLEAIKARSVFNGCYYEPGIIPAVWNKIIRRTLFFDDFIPPDYIIRMGDDAAVTYPMIARAKSIVIYNEFYPYHYRAVEGSMSRSYDTEYLNRCLQLLKGLSANLKNYENMISNLKYYSMFVMSIGIMQLCSKASGLSLLKQRKILSEFIGKYKALEIDMSYNWDEIKDTNKCWLIPLMDGNIDRMVFELYMMKVRNKVLELIYGK